MPTEIHKFKLNLDQEVEEKEFEEIIRLRNKFLESFEELQQAVKQMQYRATKDFIQKCGVSNPSEYWNYLLCEVIGTTYKCESEDYYRKNFDNIETIASLFSDQNAKTIFDITKTIVDRELVDCDYLELNHLRTNLSLYYFYGIGTEQNFEESLKYNKIAADLGHGEAQYYYALHHSFTEEEAFNFYKLPADQKFLPAICLAKKKINWSLSNIVKKQQCSV